MSPAPGSVTSLARCIHRQREIRNSCFPRAHHQEDRARQRIIDSGIECAPNGRLPSLQLAVLRELPGSGADHGREQLEVVVGAQAINVGSSCASAAVAASAACISMGLRRASGRSSAATTRMTSAQRRQLTRLFE